MEKITNYLIQPTVFSSEVRAWKEVIMLPTYAIGEEEKNPIFLEKRVYQGSTGSVYPYPVVESISDEKSDQPYEAYFIENEYIKVMILPQLGGRIQMAYDKVHQRHFVYYNQVVKPALVGLTGPWISGGIEFNWPQHHRPSTYLPIDSTIERHADGSITVWCNEVERMFRTKGMHGFRLYPGKSYIEINVRVYNRTPLPQTFLWWANPAVVVHEHYHSVFPNDVNAVFDHGKRDVSAFPIAKGVYYKHDYSQGIDISRYENIPVPTSYMAINSKYDFVGGYEENHRAGLLHVADHHVNSGKKQWTWGNGDFGQAWDRNLTDEDGPYIELMTGMYCDNQPDFTWLQPYEEKSWTQYFMPYNEVGYVKNATKEAVVNMEIEQGNVRIILYTTAQYNQVHITLKDAQGQVLLDTKADLSPDIHFETTLQIGATSPIGLVFEASNFSGRSLVRYQVQKSQEKEIPDPAQAAQLPTEINSIEQLFLTGHHLEQYRHATYQPTDYYLEALRREPLDIRCNNAMGLWLMRKGQFAQAQPYFEQAVQTQIQRNPNPYDGEPHYNLGWSLKMQGKTDQAYDALYKATWNAALQDIAYFSLAQIDVQNNRWEQALDHLDRSLIRNWHNHKARQLKTSVLRHLERTEEAQKLINESLEIDKFNMGIRFEHYLLTKEQSVLQEMNTLMRGWVHNYLEYAIDFSSAGLYDEAIELLKQIPSESYPMYKYALGYIYNQKGMFKQAIQAYKEASKANPKHCFPNKLEEVLWLQDAIKSMPTEAKAYYYIGNFWYAARQYDQAIYSWNKSSELDGFYPTVWRNLALANYNKLNNREKALTYLERSFELDPSDSRILMELDALYKRLGRPYAKRLENLERYLPQTLERDDLYIELVTLYNQLGRYQEALDLISNRKFHPWEGGEGKVPAQNIIACIQLAKQKIEDGQYTKAVELLHRAERYPHNFGEGKLSGAEENDIHYYLGIVYQQLQQEDKAQYYLQKATVGASEPKQAFFYNDQQPDKIYYQGLSALALGKTTQAEERFYKLIHHGQQHLNDQCQIDYFAVSLPDLAIWDDDLNKRNQIHCHYVMGLGYLGLGDTKNARKHLNTVLSLDINHQGAQNQLPA